MTNETSTSSLGRRAKFAVITATVISASALFCSGFVKASSGSDDFETEAEIAKLTSCYAYGTDAIGRGDLQGGKNIYSPCFTSNAQVAVYFPGTPLNGPPSFTTVGANSWADFVSGVFTTNGYTSTQHLMGTISVNVTSSSTATMTSYLHATHVVADGTIDVANGTYEDTVIRVDGKWKIKKRTLKLITFLNLGTAQ